MQAAVIHAAPALSDTDRKDRLDALADEAINNGLVDLDRTVELAAALRSGVWKPLTMGRRLADLAGQATFTPDLYAALCDYCIARATWTGLEEGTADWREYGPDPVTAAEEARQVFERAENLVLYGTENP